MNIILITYKLIEIKFRENLRNPLEIEGLRQ